MSTRRPPVLQIVLALLALIVPAAGAVSVGTYTGTTSQGKPISVFVGPTGHVTGWTYGYDCTSFSGSGTTAISSCPISSDSFSNCGSSSCIPFVANSRLSGTFVGDSLSGALAFGVQPDLVSGCCSRSLTYTATKEGSGGTGPCVANATTLCLNRDRFQVSARYETSGGQSGDANVVELTADTGYLWFFAPTNVEVVIKVLDACGFPSSPRYWVFAGGLTDVKVDITVVDRNNGTVRTYQNPMGVKFAPVQDTSAFATCP